jgi:putative hemolysin
MSGVGIQLALVFALVLLNAAFAGSELALVSLREGQLQRLEATSARGALLAKLAREPNRFLATIQIGITLAGFLASASAAVSLARPIEDHLGFLGGAAEAVSVLGVTIVLSYITLVFGELAPKRLAMQKAEAWGLIAARPLAALSSFTRPAVWLLARSADVAVRLLGGDPDRQRDEMTDEELREMVAAHDTLSEQQRSILTGAFEIAERRLNEVLRPRPEVIVLDVACTNGEAMSVLVEAGYTRAPVAERGDLDQVVGVVHLRDVVSQPTRPVREVVSPVVALPESVTVLEALRRLQAERQQLALVVNEHGGAEGIVTVEDLVEELVGEIYDESDRDIVAVEHEADGSLVLPGRFPVHDLTDIGVELPTGEYATIAGLVLDRLGRIPDGGESVQVEGWTLTVLEVERRAICRVHLKRT